MKKKIEEIKNTDYGVGDVSCEPAKCEIARAIQTNNLEARSFQEDIDELNAEWNKEAKSENEYFELQKKYHAQRVAYLVVNKWSDPILLRKDGATISDGLHRLKAAVYLEMEEVDVVLEK